MQPRRHMTVEEYFAFDEADPDMRWEYWDGEVVPVHGYDRKDPTGMAGASPRHVQITTNLAAELHSRLRKKGCRVASSELRTAVSEGRYVYPDLVVTCSEPVYDAKGLPLQNPELVIKVASLSTEHQDRRDKLERYTLLPSVQGYWIEEQDEPLVTQYVRTPEGWLFQTTRGSAAAVRCEAFDVELPLEDIYALVSF